MSIENFIFVQVDQNYDCVEDVKHIANFPTADVAQAFVKDVSRAL